MSERVIEEKKKKVLRVFEELKEEAEKGKEIGIFEKKVKKK
ncbi:MAG: hypothetical protein ACTSXD_06105 [Candidatus Heimdallarchaeaceae archaeon]